MGTIIMSNKDPGFKVIVDMKIISKVLPHWLEKKNDTQHNSSRSDQRPTTHALLNLAKYSIFKQKDNRKSLSYCMYICFHFCLSLLNSYVFIFPSSLEKKKSSRVQNVVSYFLNTHF